MSNTQNDQPFYMAQNSGFGKINAEDDLLHPEQNQWVQADSLTETQYFGFSIPEEKIHAIGYMWHHPNLHVVTGGLCVFQGIKRTTLEAELCDLRAFMSDRVLANDLHEYRLANGYGVKVLEPLKRFHLTYSDPARQHVVDLEIEGIQPPVMYADEKHFDQTMHVKGKLLLRGKPYEVDCFNVRDRSWGKPREEEVLSLPPLSWMTGVFSRSFAFQATVMDQAGHNPEIKDRFELPEENTVMGGWIQRDGKLGRIVKASKQVVRDTRTLLPMSMVLELTDNLDRIVKMQGTLIAALPYPQSLNINAIIGLMRWECEGLVTHGDCQEGLWNDYISYMSGKT